PLTHTLVAVRSAPGRRDLVRMNVDPVHGTVGAMTTLASETETQFNAPRLSRDGRMIVAERHRLGAQSEIVLVDATTGALRVVLSDPETRWTTPTWSAADFAIVAAGAKADEPFNLFEVELVRGQRRQVTHTTGGALWPVLSPDQKTLIYVGYTTEGFDLFSMPYAEPHMGTPLAPLTMQPYTPPVVESAIDPARAPAPPSMPANRPYTPWATLPPTSWSPIVEADRNQFGVGAAVSGFDV